MMTHHVEQVTKAFSHGEVLYLTCPSKRGGEYLIAVAWNKSHNTIVVGHDCPAIRRGSNCWHVRAAVNAFKEWRWWEVPEDVKVISLMRSNLTLNQDFKQIPVPGSSIILTGTGGMTYGRGHNIT